jgi:nucleoside-specific channel-forming protein
MKKTLVILLGLLLATSMFADFTWGQLNFYEGISVSNPYGSPFGDAETYNLTYFEIEGGGRTGILNLYYFVDVEHIFGIRDEQKEGISPGSYFMKINPRFSMSSFVPKLGPIKEMYLATQYKGWNGGDNYYVGLGTDLAIPYFDSFSFNFYKMFQNINPGEDTNGDGVDDSWEASFEDAGWVVAINWYTNVKKFSDDFNLTYQGWSDFGFSNKYSEDQGAFWIDGPEHVATEWQMFNGFFWNYKKWSLSTSVKFHNNFLYTDLETHDAISPWIGLHRRF